ncbi:MAG: DNA-processing protein DprA [Candidatus Omnitrophica bacterium]|nr:DNA-processing protein DprA [Candidatus Omnitrophota bacterium]
MTSIDSLLILNAIPGLGPIRIKQLLSYFVSAKKVLLASQKEILSLGCIPKNVAQNISEFPKEEFLEKEHALMKSHDVNVCAITQESFPKNLKNISDTPVVLYVKGTLEAIDANAISIVGSRRASVYGTSTAEKFAMQLSDFGITVVSGMARGIDTAAHRGALRAKGRTIAVLGSGLANIYPPENKKLAEDISRNGAVISEFPMSTKPLAGNFPRRNRIVSGLSLGVIVVEAAQRSGALITADLALEQGREVFAIPGKVDSPSAQGTNNLIKQGAKLVSSIEDVLEDLQINLKNARLKVLENDDQTLVKNLSDVEQRIFDSISLKPTYLDQILEKTGLSISQASSGLLSLELKRLIKQLPGKLFVRI